MAKSEGEFVAIVDLAEGEHQYKFVVDGNWEHDPNQMSIDDNYNGRNNVVAVKRSDFESSDAVAPVREQVTETVPSATEEVGEEIANLIPAVAAQEKPVEDLKEPAETETTTESLVDIEPTPVVQPSEPAEEKVQTVQEIAAQQVKKILESLTSFVPKENTNAETMPKEDIAEPLVVPDEKQEPAVSDADDDFFQLASKVLENEEPAELFAQIAQDPQLMADLQEAAPQHQVDVFDELKKLAEHPTMQKSDLELMDILTSNFASQFQEEQQKQMIEDEANNFLLNEQPTDSIEHLTHEPVESNEPAIEELEEVTETQQNLAETHKVPSSDSERLIAEELVENLVEIIDLTEKGVHEAANVNERRPSIVIEHKNEVRVCDLDHSSDGSNSNDKLIKNEANEKTELKPRLLDQPFFQRLSSLSIKEKLMVCFGGLVAIFVFAASVFF